MLGRCLLLSPLFLVLPPRMFQQIEGQPEASPNAPESRATDPARGQSRSRAALEDATPLRSAEWLQQVEREIERAESFWSSTPDGAYSAPNRSQNLRSRIGPAGLEVSPRETQENGGSAPWQLKLRTLSFGSENDPRPLGEPRIARFENRIDLHYAALSEWFVNDERGIEQGWTVPAPPLDHAGSSCRIEIEASGLRSQIARDGQSVIFVDDAARICLRYQHLRAWDASGRELLARLLPTRAGLAIHVESEDALYPITVDPVLGGPVWTAQSDQFSAFFGTSVSGAGDVNGDGFDDVIVGAPWFEAGQQIEGRAFLYLGSASGPSLAPDWTAESDQANAEFAFSVSGAGDVNGDGFDDVIVGAKFFDHGQDNEGRAYLYLGSAGGPSLAPDWTAESDQPGAVFGSSVSGAGDVNADGFDDVIVGASSFDHAFLYLGSAGGPSLAPNWMVQSDQDSNFGWSVCGAQDVNGDGFDDVIVGAPAYDNGQALEGRAFLYLGSVLGPSIVPDWTAGSDQAGANFGVSVSGAGDVNRDGFDDLIIGAPNGQSDQGRAFLFLGSAGVPSLAPDWMAESGLFAAYFGISVSGARDVNGDGFDDVIVGAYRFHHGQTAEGRAYLYLGSAGGPSLAPDWTAESDSVGAYFGFSVSSAGDVNADGLDDVIVGAPWFDDGQGAEGRAYVYLGCGPIGTKYCIATANSTGAPAELSACCSASSAVGNLTLEAAPVPDQSGVFFHGLNQTQNPFGNGFMCATGGIVRGSVIVAVGNVATYTYDNSDPKHSLSAFIGTTRNFQYWFRDPAGGGSFFNTSNAISIAVLP